MNIPEAATAEEIETTEEQEKESNDFVRIPPIVTVHATAIFENSPNSNVMQDEIDSLVRIITSKNHLARNVNDVLYSILPSTEFGHQNFKHSSSSYKCENCQFMGWSQGVYLEALKVRHLDTRQWEKDWTCQYPSEALVIFLPLHIWEFLYTKIL